METSWTWITGAVMGTKGLTRSLGVEGATAGN